MGLHSLHTKISNKNDRLPLKISITISKHFEIIKMGILNRINPFVQVMYDDKLNAKRKNLDAALTLVFIIVTVLYMVDSVNTWLNPHVYTSKCLTTGISLPPVTVKDLCYTPEKPYDPALTAFTCRGTFGNEVWAIATEAGPDTPTGGGRMLNNNNNQPPNNNNNNNNQPSNSNSIVATTDAVAFCRNVINHESAVLRPFGPTSAAAQNEADGILEYDKSKTYTMDNVNYYEIKGHGSASSTFTCCGWSKMSSSNRVLGYLAAVGGFAGFIKALLASIPPHHHREDETKSDQVNPAEKNQESI